MPLITVTATMVRSHGGEVYPPPMAGVIDWTPATHGVYGRSLRARDSVRARIVDGVMDPVTLTPGPWDVLIRPDDGIAWDAFTVDLDASEPVVDLVDLAPVVVVDGQPWARGASIASITPDGDGHWIVTLTDGTALPPLPIPVGDPGHTPVLSWDGTRLLVDGVPGPDLAGPQGPPPAVSWEGTALRVGDEAPVDLAGAAGHSPIVGMDGDRVTVDGAPVGPHLTGPESTVPGPANALSIGEVVTGAPGSAAAAVIEGDAPVQVLSLTLPRGDEGPPGQPGADGDLVEAAGTLTRGAATTGGTLTLTAVGGSRILEVAGVTASGGSEVLATLDPADAGTGAGMLLAVVSGVSHLWPVVVSGTTVSLPGPAVAGHVLSGSILWRSAS